MFQKSKRYCICRSKDSNGFMIGCENCDEWFHGKCIQIRKRAADLVDTYYCDSCIIANPSLKIVYKFSRSSSPEKNPVSTEQEASEESRQEKEAFEENVQTEPTQAEQNKRDCYCICRSKETNELMINCENCDEWFHGRCINIRDTEANLIDTYYCDQCIQANPSFRIVYKLSRSPPPASRPVLTEQEPLKESRQEEEAPEENVQTKPTKANQSKRRVFQFRLRLTTSDRRRKSLSIKLRAKKG